MSAGRAVLAAAVLMAVVPSAPVAAATAETCVVVRVQNERYHDLSTMDRVELPSGAVTPLGELGYQVNALGYSPGQDLTYGLTADGEVVTIDRRGHATELASLPDLADATAGVIAGNLWYVKRFGLLYTVDVDPVSPDYLSVRGEVRLRPWFAASEVDDFAMSDGLLYGVAAGVDGGIVVSIDPGTGRIHPVRAAQLPPSTTFGAVVLGPDGDLYVTANDSRGLSRVYRVPLDGSPATELATGPPVTGTDAAGCLTQTAPPAPIPPPATMPPPSPTTPPPTPTITPAPTTRPPTTSVPPLPIVAPHREITTTPAPHVSTSPSTPHALPTRERAEPATQPNETKTKRRWAVATLVLILGAGIIARRLAR